MNKNRVFAITKRKLRSLAGDPRTLVFVCVMPAVMMLLFGFAIGGQPTNLTVIGVGDHPGMDPAKNSDLIDFQTMESVELAIDSLEHGDAWCVLVASNGTMTVYLDASNQQVTQTLLQELQPRNATSSYNVISVYGSTEGEFIEFLAPGIFVLVCFMFSVMLTAMAFVSERGDGTLDRVFAAGAEPSEVLAGHLLSYLGVLAAQVAIMLTISFGVFQLSLQGSILLLFALAFGLGFAAMCAGLYLSSKAKSEFQALQLVMPMTFPVLLLSGILWPIEALPKFLASLSYALPTTWVAEAFRSVMVRGWGLEHEVVLGGFVSIAVFGLGMLALASRSLRQ